eukprot:138722-Prorocentrum_minimum.AAC.1
MRLGWGSGFSQMSPQYSLHIVVDSSPLETQTTAPERCCLTSQSSAPTDTQGKGWSKTAKYLRNVDKNPSSVLACKTSLKKTSRPKTSFNKVKV